MPSLARLDAAETIGLAVPLREDYVAGGVLEPESLEIDVAALHQGYLRGLRTRGGRLLTEAGVSALARNGDLWHAETPVGAFAAPVVINAAGAWCDAVCRARWRCADRPSAEAPDGVHLRRAGGWRCQPMADGCTTSTMLFISSPMPAGFWRRRPTRRPRIPATPYPEELDIAVGADRIMQAMTLEIRHIRNKWAGLRSFVRDRQPVAGFDVAAEGFLLAGRPGWRRHHDRAGARCHNGGDCRGRSLAGGRRSARRHRRATQPRPPTLMRRRARRSREFRRPARR